MSLKEEALEFHKKGKIEIKSRVSVKNNKDLALAYTPGVAEVSKEIFSDKSKVYDYTSKWNNVAIVTDGSRVLGLGNVGPEAALPVMEGKAILFKLFANVDAFPICLATQDTEKIIEIVKNIAPSFGGINLEDIATPKCFEIEERLKKELDIPVFHDDQHGTAVVVLAGLINALKIVNKDIENVRIVVNGSGAAGIAISKILISSGAKNIILCDTHGAIYEGRTENMNKYKEQISKITNREKFSGSLNDVIKGADVFIGVSTAGVLTKEMVRSMSSDAIVFALSNPVPEIMPDEAKEGGARIIATGRSDFPNQINNVLCFPGMFRGALDVRARMINEEMKFAAAKAIADLVKDQLDEKYIIPNATDPNVSKSVAHAVADAAIKTNVAKL
ncbi:MAG: malic enzyme-like NAD(P)-binding protein [Candidatus Aenigmatarchaeota archaeon]